LPSRGKKKEMMTQEKLNILKRKKSKIRVKPTGGYQKKGKEKNSSGKITRSG